MIRGICCFVLFLVMSVVVRFPVTEGMDLFCNKAIVLAAAFSFAVMQYIWGSRRLFYIHFSAFVCLYTSVAYIAVLDGMKLSAAEVTGAMGLGAIIFCMIAAVCYIGQSVSRRRIRWLIYGIAAVGTAASLLPPLFLWGYYAVSGHLLTADIVLTLFQTNLSETISYMKDKNIVLWGGTIIAVLALIGGSMMAWQKMAYVRIAKKTVIVLMVIMVAVSITATKKMIPLYTVVMAKSVYHTLDDFKAYGVHKTERQDRLNELATLHIAPQEGGVYVLVIGESETRDHMHVYGYDREDTPWLDTFARETGTLVFAHAYSNHTHTVPVLTYALSEKNQYNTLELTDAYSIMEIAKAAGYRTYWISNQQKYGAWDTPVAEIASTADTEVWINGNVGKQTKTLYNDGTLAAAMPDLQGVKNAFIVVHLMGSHGLYSDRYPEEYARFSGGDTNVDTYDNSILYNDSVLQRLYHAVSGNPHFKGWIYLSDHGDDADAHKGHESTKFTCTMSHIPLIMHFSPAFIAGRPDTYQQLMAHQDAYWTNDLLYDALVDILGIQGVPRSEPALDLASPQYDRTKETLTTLHGNKELD